MSSWIPFYTTTVRKPEIVTMALRCNVTRNEVLGACVTLWCYASENSTDGRLAPMTRELLADVICTTTCIVEGMIEVGWLVEGDGWMQVPNATWLAVGDKARMSNAERQRRYRKRQREKTQGESPKPQSDGALHGRYFSVTREDKIREEYGTSSSLQSEEVPGAPKKRRKKLLSAADIPVPPGWNYHQSRELFQRWIDYRAESRFPPWVLATWESKLADFATFPRFAAAIEHSIREGWKGLFEPKQKSGLPESATPAIVRPASFVPAEELIARNSGGGGANGGAA